MTAEDIILEREPKTENSQNSASNSINKTTSCCFSGHRPAKLKWGDNESDIVCKNLKQLIYDTIETVYDSGIRHYICGMAPGSDFYFCEAVLKLRAKYPEITLEAAIPYEGQSNAWREEDKARYNRLTDECDYITVVQSYYSPECMYRRNSYMVDSSRVLIAAYNGQKGGTMQTMLYAMRRGLEIIELMLDS